MSRVQLALEMPAGQRRTDDPEGGATCCAPCVQGEAEGRDAVAAGCR